MKTSPASIAVLSCLLVQSGMAISLLSRLRAQPRSAALIEVPTLPDGEESVTNISDVVEGLAMQGAKAGVTPGLTTFVDQIKKMVNEDMKPKVIKQHDETVLLVGGLKEAFSTCGNQKQQEDLGVSSAKTARGGRSEDHKACRLQEAAAYAPKKGCDDTLVALESAKDNSCNNPYLTQVCDAGMCNPTPGVTYELWVQAKAAFFVEKDKEFQRLKKKCVDDTKLVDEKIPLCKQLDIEYTAKNKECDVEQTNLESAACSQAEKTKASCEAFTACYQAAEKNLNDAKPSVEAQIKDRKGEWRALMRIECLFGVFFDQSGGTGVNTEQIDQCKAITHDTSQLDIAFPEAPGQSPCIVGGSEPCLDNYLSEEYLNLPVDAGHKVCTPCAWNTPTTTGSPTR